MFVSLIHQRVLNRNILPDGIGKRIHRIGEHLISVHKPPGGVVRQFGVDSQNQFAQLHNIEGRDGSRLVGIGGDHFVRTAQR